MDGGVVIVSAFLVPEIAASHKGVCFLIGFFKMFFDVVRLP